MKKISILLIALQFPIWGSSLLANQALEPNKLERDNLEKKIKTIEETRGSLSIELYSSLLNLAELQIQEKSYPDAKETLIRAQNIGHRNKGVLNLDQITIINKLTNLAILEENFRQANQYQRFLFFLRKKRSADSENIARAQIDMANWLTDTGQTFFARSLLKKSLENARDVPALQLEIAMAESRNRRIDGLCCGWKKLEAILDSQPAIGKELIKEAYLEIADSLTLNRKSKKAAEYYNKARFLSSGKELFEAKPIAMKKRLEDITTVTTKYYIVERDLAYPRRIREMTEDEMDNNPGFEPTWFAINPAQRGFTLPDRNEPRKNLQKSRKLVGTPLLFQKKQIENIQGLKTRKNLENIRIELVFDVASDGNLENIEVMESNASPRMNRLMINSLKKIYFRPALDESGPIKALGVKLVQTFSAPDRKST